MRGRRRNQGDERRSRGGPVLWRGDPATVVTACWHSARPPGDFPQIPTAAGQRKGSYTLRVTQDARILMRNRASAIGLFVVLAGAWLTAGCSDRRVQADAEQAGPPVRGGTLEIVGYSDVDHLATTSSYLASSIWLSSTWARQLLSYPVSQDFGTATRPAPDLALDVPTRENGGLSPDGLSYTFHLRRGIRWNSRPPRDIVAADIVRAFLLFCNPVSPVGAADYYTRTIVGMARYCEQFAGVDATVPAIRAFMSQHRIAGIEAPDDHTVVFKLAAPATDFPNLLAMPFASPVPVEYLDYLPDSPEFRRRTIASGPYQIVKYAPNREILLERNPAWDPRTDPIRPAYVDRIRVRLGVDAQLQLLQIQAGTADLGIEDVPSSSAAPLLAIGDSAVWLSPPGDLYANFDWLMFNRIGPRTGAVLGRREVRHAIATAVNKAAVVQVAGGRREARPLHQAVPSSVSGFAPGADYDVTPGSRGDFEAARRALDKAGLPPGTTLRLAYPILGSVPIMAQSVQASLARAGMDIQLVPATAGDFYGRLLANPENARRGEWDLAIASWIPDWFGRVNARSVTALLFDGRQADANTPNYGHYQNAAVDSAIDDALTAPAEDLSVEAWRKAARLLMEDVAHVPLVERKTAFARSRRVRNCVWQVIGLNCNLSSVWLADRTSRPDGLR